MKDLDHHITETLKGDVDRAIVVQPARIHTGPWVTIKCQYGCHRYGQSHCCPPRTPTPERMRAVLDSYTRAVLLYRNWKEGTRTIRAFNEAVVGLEKSLFLGGYYKAWGMGSGPCTLCEKCNAPGPCLHAAQARPSMESCGIDVFRSAREYGLPLVVLKDRNEERHSFGLVLVE